MNWVTVIWSILIGACAAMALPSLFLGIRQRRPADLFFVGVAVGTIGLAAGELAMMHATSAAQYGLMQRRLGPPIFLIVVSTVGFVRFYFGTGRLWLGLTTCGVRFVCLIINFISPVNLTFTQMTGLDHVRFFGETVAIGKGVVSPWVHLAELSSLLMIAFVTDASISLWREGKPGDRRRAITVGGSIVFFVLVAQVVVILFRQRILPSPYPVSLWFFAIVAAMTLERGYDLFAAAQLARKLQLADASLRETEEKFRLAVEASPSGIVLVDHEGKVVLVNVQTEKMFGYSRVEMIGKPVEILLPERFATQHPVDRAKFFAAPQARAMGAGRELFARRKDGREFPVEIGLNPIQTPQGLLVLANVVDISARLAAEEETRRSREQVELLSRVSLLGEMTASLAHELNQPLAAIVNNATAAMQYLEQGRLGPKQLEDILTDVVGDGRRAYDIMHNVRNAIKKGSAIRGRINLNDVVRAVTHMVQPDAAAQLCRMEMSLALDLPVIEGDPTQIQQVLINLLRNAFDAMRNTPHSLRLVEVATNYNGDGTISLSVRDYGSGISESTRERLFEQFFTTKTEGLGMGLAIVRSIVETHGGTISAENADGGGARFHFRLPIKEGMTQ